jgi:hypothetical protein
MPGESVQEDCEVLSDTYAISLQHENLHNASENSLDKFIALVEEESQLLKSNEKRIDEISVHEVQYTAKIVDHLGNSDTWLISQTWRFPCCNDMVYVSDKTSQSS